MKKGLFGGTFNPVHTGHVRLVTTLRSAFCLDQVIVVPTALPPHKNVEEIASPQDRFHMARLAFESIPGVCVSDAEMHRPGRAYTIDTVRSFLSAEPETTSLFLILGLDSFLALHTWKSYMALVEAVPLIVFTRTTDPASEKAEFEAFLSSTLSKEYTFCAERNRYLHPSLCPIFFYSARRFDVSATDIRRRIRAGRPINMLVPERVAHYIQKKGLYI